MHSCLYTGWVRHRRFMPRPHAFRYRLFMVYLDLAELDTVFAGQWFWSVERWNLACFRRRDYLGPLEIPLDTAVREAVRQHTGQVPTGPVRVLTHLRYFGHCFNPVTFYYVFDCDDTRVECVIAEIHNTPWNQRRAYVLTPAGDTGTGQHHRWHFAKDFHISPFMPMDVAYDWRFSEPGARLNVHMRLDREEGKLFDATLALKRRPMTPPALTTVLLRYPLMTVQVLAGIYWQAARLQWRGMPVYDHPDGL